MIEYIKVQQAVDAKVDAALRDASKAAETELGALKGKQGAGAAVRSAQLLATKLVIGKVLKELFSSERTIISEGQSIAASLAEKLLIKDESGIWRIIEKDKSDRQKIQENLSLSAARNIQAVMMKILDQDMDLSKRVYKTEALAKRQVEQVVTRGIALGSDPSKIAKDVRTLINPDVPGGVSYRAKTLARTEVNNAFHAQSIHDMQNRPWVKEAQWNLSKSHGEEEDICDQYAEKRFFPVDSIPKKPHPGCLCSITPRLPDLDEALKNFLAGKYGPWLP